MQPNRKMIDFARMTAAVGTVYVFLPSPSYSPCPCTKRIPDERINIFRSCLRACTDHLRKRDGDNKSVMSRQSCRLTNQLNLHPNERSQLLEKPNISTRTPFRPVTSFSKCVQFSLPTITYIFFAKGASDRSALEVQRN